MDAVSQPGDLALPLAAGELASGEVSGNHAQMDAAVLSRIPATVLEELWLAADAETCELTREEFSVAVSAVGEKYHFGLPSETLPTPTQEVASYRSLRLPELSLAQGCALGRANAWQKFIALYRVPLIQAAIAITGSATLGHDLADSLYAELFGLTERGGQRRSPLESYSARGSLLGWLRATLAQRHVDHHRRTYRETPLDDLDAVAPAASVSSPIDLNRLKRAVSQTLEILPAEDCFLLTSYFLDQKTPLQISHLLRVHEATVSRKLKRVTANVRKQLLRNLQSGGLSKRAAEEALGTDPRDLDISLRSLLQCSQSATFSDKTSRVPPNSR